MKSKDLFTDELTEIKQSDKRVQKKTKRELELEKRIAELQNELEQKKPKVRMSIAIDCNLKELIEHKAKAINISASEYISRLIKENIS